MATISKNQLDELKSIAKEHKIAELSTIVKNLKKQIGSIKMKCPEHDKTVLIHDNASVYVNGINRGNGAEVVWNNLIPLKEWTNAFNTVITTNPNYEFANEWFGGRTSDTCFTAIQILKACNVCCCPEIIHAFNILKPTSNENILRTLEMATEDENENEDDNEHPKNYDSDGSDNSKNNKKNGIQYTIKDSTPSFRYFINRVTKIPQRNLKDHDRVDITNFLS